MLLPTARTAVPLDLPLLPTSAPLIVIEVNALRLPVTEPAPNATSLAFLAFAFVPTANALFPFATESKPVAIAPSPVALALAPVAIFPVPLDVTFVPIAIEPTPLAVVVLAPAEIAIVL